MPEWGLSTKVILLDKGDNMFKIIVQLFTILYNSMFTHFVRGILPLIL
jgi:hypothetical protein